MNIISDVDFSDREVMDFLAEQESQEIRSADHWRDALLSRLETPLEASGIKLPWPKTHPNVRLRPGEVSLWAGINGHFKSSIANQCALYSTSQAKVGIMSFEMPAEVTLERMTKQAAGRGSPPKQFANDLLDYLSTRMWIYDHLDSVDPARALACVHYMAKIGIELVVVDCLIMVRGVTRDTERESQFMSTLIALAKAHKIHIALVHHVRKPQSGGDEYVPTRFDIRGASDIGDMASSIFILHNNKRKAEAIRKRDVGASLSEPEEKALAKPCQLFIVAKQRNAPFEGAIGLNLNREAMQFRESERQRLHLVFDEAAA